MKSFEVPLDIQEIYDFVSPFRPNILNISQSSVYLGKGSYDVVYHVIVLYGYEKKTAFFVMERRVLMPWAIAHPHPNP